MREMRKMLIVGPSIERGGIGGVTVHCQRLRDWLDKEGFPYEFADYKALGLWGTIRRIAKSKIAHINVSNPTAILLFVIAARLTRCKTIMTLHGSFDRFKGLKRFLMSRAIAWSNTPIALNGKSFKSVNRLNKSSVEISAFIPQEKDEKLPQKIIDFIENDLSYFELFVTNASAVAFDKDGREIYGIDFLVEWFERQRYNALIVSDPSGQYAERYKGREFKHVYLISEPHSYFELIKLANATIRNTSTDGDSLSVKESLYLGKRTLCSDTVERPEGVTLFKYCDEKSFYEALRDDTNSSAMPITNGAVEILKIYNSLIE